VAFVPGFEGYTEYDITVSDNEFIAISEDRYFHVVGYSPEQFTNKMLKLWEYELR